MKCLVDAGTFPAIRNANENRVTMNSLNIVVRMR